MKLDKNGTGNWDNEEIDSIFNMAIIENETDELKKYLKDNNLKILREA